MREKDIEAKLRDRTSELGGWALKFTSPGVCGVPDRLVLLPDGKIGFVELKAPGEKLRPIQEMWSRHLKGLGFKVFCIDGVDQIEEVLNEIRTA